MKMKKNPWKTKNQKNIFDHRTTNWNIKKKKKCKFIFLHQKICKTHKKTMSKTIEKTWFRAYFINSLFFDENNWKNIIPCNRTSLSFAAHKASRKDNWLGSQAGWPTSAARVDNLATAASNSFCNWSRVDSSRTAISWKNLLVHSNMLAERSSKSSGDKPIAHLKSIN